MHDPVLSGKILFTVFCLPEFSILGNNGFFAGHHKIPAFSNNFFPAKIDICPIEIYQQVRSESI